MLLLSTFLKNPKKGFIFIYLNCSMFFLWNNFDYILTPCTKLSYCQVQHQAQNWQPKHWRCLWCSPLEKPQKSFQGSILAPSQFRLAYDQHSFQFGSGLQAQNIYWDSKLFATIFYHVNYGSSIIPSKVCQIISVMKT